MSLTPSNYTIEQALTFKRGDTFSAVVVYEPAEGEPESMTGMVVEMNVRNMATGASLSTAVAELSLDGKMATFKVKDTGKWLLGLADWDIRFSQVDGLVTHTRTRHLQVIKAVMGE